MFWKSRHNLALLAGEWPSGRSLCGPNQYSQILLTSQVLTADEQALDL